MFSCSSKIFILLTAILAIFLFFMMQSPIAQNLHYHQFVDEKNFWGIKNSLNVLSNIPFLIVGFYGLITLNQLKKLPARLSWKFFFIGIILVAPGSAYYHYWPNNSTLVWDRLPMTIGFMGLFSALITTYVNANLEKRILFASILIGFVSVIYWNLFDDLRLYYFVQFMPLAIIPLIIFLYKGNIYPLKHMILALSFYVLAKWVEFRDGEIYHLTGQVFSGHSLKHILAAVSPLIIIVMLKSLRNVTAADPLLDH